MNTTFIISLLFKTEVELKRTKKQFFLEKILPDNTLFWHGMISLGLRYDDQHHTVNP